MSAEEWKGYAVRITTALGVNHVESQTPSIDKANAYARTAILDGCLRADVITRHGGTALASWVPGAGGGVQRVKPDLSKPAGRTPR